MVGVQEADRMAEKVLGGTLMDLIQTQEFHESLYFIAYESYLNMAKPNVIVKTFEVGLSASAISRI